MLYVLINYNFDPTWVKEYTDDYLIYDRSDDGRKWDIPQDKLIITENVGNVDFDKLSYLVDNYDNLPDVFLWGKSNLLKEDTPNELHVSPHIYMTKEEFDKVKDNKCFTPLLTQNHKTYTDDLGVVCYYEGGMYYERSSLLYGSDWKYFKSYPEFAHAFNIPCEYYVPFAPGGNYILTREAIHRYSRDLYVNMRDILPYQRLPIEAHWCERAYYTLWK